MFNEIVKMVEETVCSYFRNVRDWSLDDIAELIDHLQTHGSEIDFRLDLFNQMSNRDILFIETVMAAAGEVVNSNEPDYPYDGGDDMDGDHESALSSAGYGTDEDYGGFDHYDEY